ncbi:hypothetical protein AT2G41515 [Arabidopsis thaliana]|uniref:Uncharacterized protein n=1 Tax=Arabidopsis thaliana TaxID=3702 RepID=A0A1P8AYP2_ARATH|nr:uncharacterized protein AT2G41515 [Arabidopsis thaliana]ANM61743.1 hypothetical protein AT2G41515 [Arabidopsis thaliana]|eukprot:NP_001323944.1 hypothetical protein AT2G41515 [Arabidopsis thaliana]
MAERRQISAILMRNWDNRCCFSTKIDWKNRSLAPLTRFVDPIENRFFKVLESLEGRRLVSSVQMFPIFCQSTLDRFSLRNLALQRGERLRDRIYLHLELSKIITGRICFWHFAHLLGLIDWINKDRTVVVACENVVENFCSKLESGDSARDVEPPINPLLLVFSLRYARDPETRYMALQMKTKWMEYNLTLKNFTICGAGSREIRARVIMPNCPSPPRTLKKSSEFRFSEQSSVFLLMKRWIFFTGAYFFETTAEIKHE